MPDIGVGTAALIGGGISGVGSLASGIFGSGAAKDAASVQAAAALQAAQIQQDTALKVANLQQSDWEQVQNNLQPFISGGQTAFGNLNAAIPGLTTNAPTMYPGTMPGLPGLTANGGRPINIDTSFRPTMDWLANTPGYQFSLQQGKQAVQNSYAAQGLGSSGAAMKGAAQYAEGLAGTTFQNQFSNWLNTQNLGLNTYGQQLAGYGAGANAFQQGTALGLNQRQLNYNMLAGPAQLGVGAATGAGGISAQFAQNIGNTLTGGAQAQAAGLTGAAAAQAAGTVGSTNALMAGLTGAGGAGSQTAMLLALDNAGLFGSKPRGVETASSVPGYFDPASPNWWGAGA